MAQSDPSENKFNEVVQDLTKTLAALNEQVNKTDATLIGLVAGGLLLFKGFFKTISQLGKKLSELKLPKKTGEETNTATQKLISSNLYVDASIKLLTSKVETLSSTLETASKSINALTHVQKNYLIKKEQTALGPVNSKSLALFKRLGSTISDTIDAEFTVNKKKGPTGPGHNPPPIPEEKKSTFFTDLFDGITELTKYNAFLSKGYDAALKTLTAAIEFTVSSLTKLATVASLFVQAFAPAYVEQFLYTLKDLSAVIGTAFLPLVQGFTNLARYLADVLLPLFTELQPVFQAFSYALIALLVPIIQSLANVLQTVAGILIIDFAPNVVKLANAIGNLVTNIINGLLPGFERLLLLFSAIINVLGTVINFLAMFGDQIAAVITGYLGVYFVTAVASAISSLITFVGSLTAANIQLALLTAGLSILLGTVAFLTAKLFSTKKQAQYTPNISQGIAARQAQYLSAEDISKNLIKAAFAGPNADRLKNIDMNGRRQVELLEQIANRRNLGVNQPNNQRGLAVA